MADILIWREKGEEGVIYESIDGKKGIERKAFGDRGALRRYGICHVETFEEVMREAAESLFKEQFYGYYEIKLTTPAKLFRKYAHLQPWGGSPGVEIAFDSSFEDRSMFQTLKLEQVGDEGGGADPVEYLTLTENPNDKSLRLLFSNRATFDNFVHTATHVHSGHAINDDLFYDSCDFSS